MNTSLHVSIFFGDHDSNVAVADDEATLLHLEAERVLRRKHAKASAEEMQFLVATALDYVAGGIDDVQTVLLAKWSSEFSLERFELLGRDVHPIVTGHHQNHVACALATGFTTGFALCADGGSEDGVTSLYRREVDGVVTRLKRLDEQFVTGRTYGAVTQLVVQPRYMDAHASDAGKLLGLAGHGRVQPELLGLIQKHAEELNRPQYSGVDQLRAAFGLDDSYERHWEDERRRDLAASMQREWEDRLLTLVEELHLGDEPFALVGGCAMNVAANGRLLRAGVVHDVNVPPAPADSGQALGALWARWPHLATASPFLGRDFGRELPLDAVPRVADDLAAGHVVGLYRGRSEIGPRALGHRSILALPCNQETGVRMSQQIKQREPYRPVAPVIRLEDLNRFYGVTAPSPYMSFAHPASREVRDKAPAIVHADGSSRVQTVSFDSDPILHALLTSLESRGMLPILANTSLNQAGEPLVETPEDAICFFQERPLDVLWLGTERLSRELAR